MNSVDKITKHKDAPRLYDNNPSIVGYKKVKNRFVLAAKYRALGHDQTRAFKITELGHSPLCVVLTCSRARHLTTVLTLFIVFRLNFMFRIFVHSFETIKDNGIETTIAICNQKGLLEKKAWSRMGIQLQY